ncbi:MAG: phenyltransferase domain-containing protein [Desulfobacteraceae bacterium]
MAIQQTQKQGRVPLNTDSVSGFIASLQKPCGDIPWHKDGKTDPWDLVESAMGLCIGGFSHQAELAFKWLKQNQNPDGSWYSSYISGSPLDRTRETNMASYIAAGLFHYWLVTRNTDFPGFMWETLEKGIDFALSLQTRSGEIYWAKSPEGKTDPMSLLTGSSSVFFSLKCALSIAFILGKRKKSWETAFQLLGDSIRNHRHAYNISKSRYSMYWFYPVLSGALTGEQALSRIEKYWSRYVVEDRGARCVSDRPWITVAETSELVIALHAAGLETRAKEIFSWISNCTFDDGTYWCGYTFPDMVIWPEEKISWTNAVALMAADALYSLTPASNLFSHRSWDGFVFTELIN